MKTNQVVIQILKAACIGYSITTTSSWAQSSYLGTCDASMGRDEFFRYECLRGDGSIGWMQGAKIGSGRPIVSIHNRDSASAYMLTSVTNAFPGYFCYYGEPGGLMKPSRECNESIQKQSENPPIKILANCVNKTVTFSDYPPDNQTFKFPSGWMAGGGDSVIHEAFRILCPLAFTQSGVNPPYKVVALKTPPPKPKPQPQPSPKPIATAGPRKDRDLGPAFTTTGLNRNMQRTKKYHQAVLQNMKSGRNMLGHSLVQMQVLSYEPGSNQYVSLWIQVNCTTRDWKFLDNLAILAGGRTEMFGQVRTNEMGKWACSRFGNSY